MKKNLLLIFIFIFFIGCKNKKEINLAANEWVGYAPIFYANEKGWLKKENIKLIRTVSLGESIKLYKNGLVDAFCATQYEYIPLKKQVSPIILLDKSYGGDMILSNKTIPKLKKYTKLDVYLEIDSVNSLLLKYFSKEYNISMDKFNFINGDQEQLSKKTLNLNSPLLIVTYTPYDIIYKSKGLNIISSTKTDKNLLVIDALFVNKNLIKDERFKKLKSYIDLAISNINDNPKEAYKILKNYYPSYSYKDFIQSLHNIKWINNPSDKLIKQLKNIDFYTKDLIYEN